MRSDGRDAEEEWPASFSCVFDCVLEVFDSLIADQIGGVFAGMELDRSVYVKGRFSQYSGAGSQLSKSAYCPARNQAAA